MYCCRSYSPYEDRGIFCVRFETNAFINEKIRIPLEKSESRTKGKRIMLLESFDLRTDYKEVVSPGVD